MSDRDQPTPPFNSPYQHAIRSTSMLQSSTYPSPARSDSEPSKYAADGLGLYAYSHPFAPTGPSVTSGLYPPSPQPTEAWNHLSSGTSPLITEVTADPWQSNYDHPASRSPPQWDPHTESHRSSISSPRGLSIFSREGSELTYPQIKLEGGSEWSDEESSPPMSHPVPMTVSPEHLTTGIFPYEHAYGSPSMPRFEPSVEDQYKQDYEPMSYEVRPQTPSIRDSSAGTARTRSRRAPTTLENANYTCGTCGMLFQRAFNHKEHVKTHDPDRKKSHRCLHSNCDRHFVRKTDLERHEKSVHLKRKDFRCVKCDAQFARKDTLRRHEEDGCPKRNELTGLPHAGVFSHGRPMRAGMPMPYYHSPRPDLCDTRSPPLFRDDSYPGTPSGY